MRKAHTICSLRLVFDHLTARDWPSDTEVTLLHKPSALWAGIRAYMLEFLAAGPRIECVALNPSVPNALAGIALNATEDRLLCREMG
jgi:hypothetical protein